MDSPDRYAYQFTSDRDSLAAHSSYNMPMKIIYSRRLIRRAVPGLLPSILKPLLNNGLAEDG